LTLPWLVESVDLGLMEDLVWMAFTLKLKGFDDGGLIPKRYTCDGEDSCPALDWSDEPQGTQSFALIVAIFGPLRARTIARQFATASRAKV